MSKIPSVAVLVALGLAMGCESESEGGDAEGADPGITLHAERGIDLVTGQVVLQGNFANSDLYATNNGSALKLTAGGPSPTESRLCDFFQDAGGAHQVFASLGSVPAQIPTDPALDLPLVKAKTGNAFVCETHEPGLYVKGWLRHADATSLTLEIEPVE
jgi:hypothetical protein